MRRPRLFWRIFVTYLIVIALCAAAVGFFAVRSARSFYVAHTETELQARAQLVREQVAATTGTQSAQALELLVRRLGAASGTRITLISAGLPGSSSGTVLADSDSLPAEMGNHSDRPEFKEALLGRTGVSIRHSTTLNEEMMYVAVPVVEDGQITSVVRAAIPLTRVNNALADLYWRIAVSTVVVAVIAALIGLFVSSRISRQMREIKEGAERLAASLTGPVARVERVRAVGVGLDRALVRSDQPIAGREAAHLVEAHGAGGHVPTSTGPMVGGRPRRRLPDGAPGVVCAAILARSCSTAARSKSSTVRASRWPWAEDSSIASIERRVTGRPPRPATTACTGIPVPPSANVTSSARYPPPPTRSARSTTITRLAPSSAWRTTSDGNGR